MGSWFSREQLPHHRTVSTIYDFSDDVLRRILKLLGNVFIGDLSDDVLQHIFKHLPLYDRLTVSAVCQRWCGIIQMPWLEVTRIDFTGIPVRYLAAVIRQCPNVRSVHGSPAPLYSSRALHTLARAPLLSSVKLYDAVVSVSRGAELLSTLFDTELLIDATWQELVLANATVVADGPSLFALRVADAPGYFATCLPLSLTHLQLIGLRSSGRFPAPEANLIGLSRLENLTCLILFGARGGCLINKEVQTVAIYVLRKLTNLRELCIGQCDPPNGFALDVHDLPFLPKLQVLFLFNVSNGLPMVGDLSLLITMHPSLRILVISGYSGGECTIPARHPYPNGFAFDPLPLLHVFLDQRPAAMIRFTHSPSTALQVYPISEPLPTFLEREDIAPLFDGVCIAGQIKEGARHGTKLYDPLNEPASSIMFA